MRRVVRVWRFVSKCGRSVVSVLVSQDSLRTSRSTAWSVSSSSTRGSSSSAVRATRTSQSSSVRRTSWNATLIDGLKSRCRSRTRVYKATSLKHSRSRGATTVSPGCSVPIVVGADCSPSMTSPLNRSSSAERSAGLARWRRCRVDTSSPLQAGVGRSADRDGQPEVDQTVRDHREDRLAVRDAESDQRGDEYALDDAESGGRDGNGRKNVRQSVGDQQVDRRDRVAEGPDEDPQARRVEKPVESGPGEGPPQRATVLDQHRDALGDLLQQ